MSKKKLSHYIKQHIPPMEKMQRLRIKEVEEYEKGVKRRIKHGFKNI